MHCFLLHIFISFNSRTTHQTSQSQAMQVWTHLRPRSPLHTPLDLLNALHLNHGHSRASPALWYVGEEKGEGNYFTCYGWNLISNWIFSTKAKTKCFIDRCLSFFAWPLCCLFFFDIQILITLLVSSNSSLNSNHILLSTKGSNKCPQFRNFVHTLMTLYSCLLI
jgi:hypothetical protein